MQSKLLSLSHRTKLASSADNVLKLKLTARLQRVREGGRDWPCLHTSPCWVLCDEKSLCSMEEEEEAEEGEQEKEEEEEEEEEDDEEQEDKVIEKL